MLGDNLGALKHLLIFLKDYLLENGGPLQMDLYKFIGDGGTEEGAVRFSQRAFATIQGAVRRVRPAVAFTGATVRWD